MLVLVTSRVFVGVHGFFALLFTSSFTCPLAYSFPFTLSFMPLHVYGLVYDGVCMLATFMSTFTFTPAYTSYGYVLYVRCTFCHVYAYVLRVDLLVTFIRACNVLRVTCYVYIYVMFEQLRLCLRSTLTTTFT